MRLDDADWQGVSFYSRYSTGYNTWSHGMPRASLVSGDERCIGLTLASPR